MKRILAIAFLAPALCAGAAPAREETRELTAVTDIPIYLAVDLNSRQILAARAADRRFPPASMTKVMTAYVAFELMAQGRLRPEQQIAVRPETAVRWSGRGTGMRLEAGQQVSVDMLLHGITTVSANDASVVLAEGVAGSVANWLALMNAEAKKLGMTGSRFGTPNGWPDGGATQVTAQDLVKLGTALVERHPVLFRRYFGKKSLTWHGTTQQNHDPTLGVVAGADGIKTGHTHESGFSFLGTAFRDGRRIMIVVGSARSWEQRAAASRALLTWSFEAWETKPLFAAGARIARAEVQGGAAREVGLVTARGVSLAVPRGTRPGATMTLHYRGPLIAPIAKGTQVAELEVSRPGQAKARFPLVAAESVARAAPFDRLGNGLAGLLR